MSSRRLGRESVLQALYAYEQSSQTEDDKNIEMTIIDESELDEKTLAFAHHLFEQVVKNLETIDAYITKVAKNWNLDRIAIVDKNILRMAICEIMYLPDIPMKVAINEAVELAKKFSTYESASFVNGILDRVFHEHE